MPHSGEKQGSRKRTKSPGRSAGAGKRVGMQLKAIWFVPAVIEMDSAPRQSTSFASVVIQSEFKSVSFQASRFRFAYARISVIDKLGIKT
jgi:hypothetical protein